MEIKAKLSSLEFYREKSGLQAGAYEVVEHDGEVNIALLHAVKETQWFDQNEWSERQEELYRELMVESDMEAMDAFIDGSHWSQTDMVIDPAHPNDCDGCGTCHLCDDAMGGDCSARDLDEMPLKNKYKKPEKSLGDLLREYIQRDEGGVV